MQLPMKTGRAIATCLLLDCASIFPAFAQDFTADKPKALERLEAERRRIERADIAWSRVDHFSTFSPHVPHLHRTKIAGPDTAFIHAGAETAAVWYADGTPVPFTRRASLYTRENERWGFESDFVLGEMWDSDHENSLDDPDVRTIGLLPVAATVMTVSDALWTFPPQYKRREYRQIERGNRIEVEMRVPDEEYLIRWVIDPARGWNAERIDLEFRGRLWNTCSVEVAQTGGVWFPTQVVYFNAAGEVVSEISVDEARINDPDLPARLTPEHIGMGTGVPVNIRSGVNDGKQLIYVRDRGVVQDEEWLGRRLTAEPAIQEAIDRHLARAEAKEAASRAATQAAAATSPASAPAPDPTILPHASDDAWDRYVREFIARYALDDEQRQRAHVILRECKERRTAFLQARRSRIDELSAAIADKDTSKRASASRELDEILAHVARIFDDELKPRLEKLPTRSQRERARSTTSAPASSRTR